ncbi:hypothetical protein [Ferrimicrobium sp.]|uniref:hypothetical protein n=1 Tax=Ferrimicrobium sp. TaxID=2926050 RepID=UPI00263A0498|nr:hypothetical protein [Ferrimicrobium sp.]
MFEYTNESQFPNHSTYYFPLAVGFVSHGVLFATDIGHTPTPILHVAKGHLDLHWVSHQD